jgi:ABC-type arginine/histidine transport system permease subunit
MSVLVTLIGLFVGPLIAVRISLKQFHSQKWWELRAEAYSKIMGQLSAVQRALDLWIDIEEGTRAGGADIAW